MNHSSCERFCIGCGDVNMCGFNDVADFVCEALAACRRVTDGLAACEGSSKSIRHHVECKDEEVSVHRGTLLAVRGGEKVVATHPSSTVVPTDVFPFVCGGWAADRRVAGRLTLFVHSSGGVPRYVRCSREKMNVRTSLLLAMKGDEDAQTN